MLPNIDHFEGASLRALPNLPKSSLLINLELVKSGNSFCRVNSRSPHFWVNLFISLISYRQFLQFRHFRILLRYSKGKMTCKFMITREVTTIWYALCVGLEGIASSE